MQRFAATTFASLVLLLLFAPASSRAGESCTTSATCDDGLFCNGAEFCAIPMGFPVGVCFNGNPPDCNDGIACTIDLCDEELDQCISAAPDMDGDGVRDASCLDGGGMPLGDDCDDDDPNRFPGNLEVCDNDDHDEDCDSSTFGEVDDDEDGFPDDQCCNLAGFVPIPGGGFEEVFNCGSDCDDGNLDVHPSIPEVCNGIDDNCRDGVDEGLTIALYRDLDEDGHGDPADVIQACPGFPGRSPLGNDCDDLNPAIEPGAVICDGQPGAVLVCEAGGLFIPSFCDIQAGDLCVTQPNGTGVCMPAGGSALDLDADGIADASDNCPRVNNPTQADANENGFGDACECGDVTGDGVANTVDARLIQRLSVGDLAAGDLSCAAR